MKINKNKSKTIIITLLLLISTQATFAYPPDNAAVLYYRACLFYKADEKMEDAVSDLVHDKIDPNEKIEEYIEKNRLAINFIIDATEVKNCDWGMDYSKGFSVMIPHLSTLRILSYLIIADAKHLTKKGDYETALTRCLALKRMGRHVNDRMLIMYLIGASSDALASKCIRQTLSDMPENLQTLNWLKNELVRIESLSFSIKTSLDGEREICGQDMRIGMVNEISKLLSDETLTPTDVTKLARQRIKSADEHFFAGNKLYWDNYYADIQTIIDLPYSQAYSQLEKLPEKTEKEVIENPDATLTAIFAPALKKVYNLEVRVKTHSNALRTAVEIYIIRAKTGKLPDNLPAGMPLDLFSNKPFIYEKTSDGFILRCQGRDMQYDKIYEYEFKIKK